MLNCPCFKLTMVVFAAVSLLVLVLLHLKNLNVLFLPLLNSVHLFLLTAPRYYAQHIIFNHSLTNCYFVQTTEHDSILYYTWAHENWVWHRPSAMLFSG